MLLHNGSFVTVVAEEVSVLQHDYMWFMVEPPLQGPQELLHCFLCKCQYLYVYVQICEGCKFHEFCE